MSVGRVTPRVVIVDFLLARIAEDEEWAPGLHDVAGCDPDYGCSCGNPARVLAECEAKRKIIRIAQIDGDVDQWGIGLDSLRALTAIYSDHPEFRREWIGG